jgi:hypothetical protein
MNEELTTNAEDSNEAFLNAVERLVGAWCDRRCYTALRYILAGYPLASGLTDDWGRLLSVFEDVRSFARDEMTHEEILTVNEMITVLNRIVFRHK